MLHTAITGFIVFLILKFLEHGNDRGIDKWVSLVLVVVPALLIFLVKLAVGFYGLPEWPLVLSTALYFIIPTIMLKIQVELPWGLSCAYGAVVIFSVVVVDLGLSYGLSAISA